MPNSEQTLNTTVQCPNQIQVGHREKSEGRESSVAEPYNTGESYAPPALLHEIAFQFERLATPG